MQQYRKDVTEFGNCYGYRFLCEHVIEYIIEYTNISVRFCHC